MASSSAFIITAPTHQQQHHHEEGKQEEDEQEEYGELLGWAASKGITDSPSPLPEEEPHPHPPHHQIISKHSVAATQINLPSSCLGHSLCIATFPTAAGGRGLAATRDLKEGELILRVPDSVLMSSRSAKQDPELKRVLDSFPSLSSFQVLTIHLLNEIAKGATSQWYLYLVHLPRVHHTLSHFSSFEAEELQDNDAIQIAKIAAQKAFADWEAARSAILLLGLSHRFATLKAWLWAAATITSRSLHVPWDEAGALCPIGDLFNYVPPGQLEVNIETDCSHSYRQSQESDEECESGFGLCIRERLRDGGYDINLGAYCFYARRHYKKGQQVLLCYGQYDNLELMEYYGFQLPDNRNNSVYLSALGLLEGHSNLGGITQHHRCHDGFQIMSSGNPSFSLLAAMRLRAASPALRKSHGYQALLGQQISGETDIAVYKVLVQTCETVLASFPTTTQEDIILLSILSACTNSNSSDIVSGFLNELFQGGKTFFSFLDKDWPTYSPIIHENVFKQLQHITKVKNFSKDSHDHGKIVDHLERWKAAIKWRLNHKAILERCIQYSNNKLLVLHKN